MGGHVSGTPHDPPHASATQRPPVSADRRHGWLGLRVRAALDDRIFWRFRARRTFPGRHTVRLEVTIPKLDVELVKSTLDRHGWRCIATERLEDCGGTASELHVVVSLVRLPANTMGTGHVRLGQQVHAALTEARVTTPVTVTVDASPPRYERRDHWVPERAVTDEDGDHDPVPFVPEAAAPSAGLHLFGSELAVRAAWERLWAVRCVPVPPLHLQRSGSQRLGRSASQAASARRATKASVWVIAATSVVFLAAVAASQAVAQASSQKATGPSPAWGQVPLLRGVLVVASIVAALSASLCWIKVQQIARARHPGDDHRSTRLFLEASRTTTLDLLDEGSLPLLYRTSLVTSAFAFAIAGGTFIGAMNVLPDFNLLSAVSAAALLAVSWAVWQLVRWLSRARGLVRGLSVGGFVLTFGHWLLYLYYAGMGIPASSVDINPVDAITVSLKPLLFGSLVAALATAVAFLLAGQAGPYRFVVVVTIVVGALAIPVASLAEAQRLGRRMGLGLTVPSAAGMKMTPGPVPRCLRRVHPDVQVETGVLPRLVWEVGTLGGDVLLLSPEEAQKRSPLPVNADPRAYVPRSDTSAPVWRVPSDQVDLSPASPDPADCSPRQPPPP